MTTEPANEPDWATRIVDFIDKWVSTIRRYTTQPLVTTARGLVFGLLGAFGFVSMVVLFIIGLTRGLQSALDLVLDHQTSVWVSYFILSAVFLLIGIILMRRRYSEEV